MRLFIVPEGKNVDGKDVDAVVCELHVQTDYDINEHHGFTCDEIDSYLDNLDRAPAASYCWLCGPSSAIS